MSRARWSVTLKLFGNSACALLIMACGGETNGPSQSVASSIAVTASSPDPIPSLGDTRTVTAVAKDASGATISSPTLSWSSSAPNVATVTGTGGSATVTSVGNGTATITASSGTVNGTVSITVTQRAIAVNMSGAPASLLPGGTAQLSAEARDAKGRGVSGVTGFTFSSADEAIAVVTAGGAVLAIAPGTAQLRANVTVGGTPLTGSSNLAVQFASSAPQSAAVAATDASQFAPPSVTIGTGGTVTWTFTAVQHNVQFGGTAGAPQNIPNTTAAQVARAFPTAGTFDYVCSLHAGMNGTVIVQGTAAAPGFIALLNGANERPNAVTTNAAGAASFVVTGTTVAYTVTFSRLSGPPSMAHIHGPGTSAQFVGVLVDFPTAGQTSTNGVLTGTFNAGNIRNAGVSFDSLLVLMRNGNAYVNVHTAANQGGEIRGQVSVP